MEPMFIEGVTLEGLKAKGQGALFGKPNGTYHCKIVEERTYKDGAIPAVTTDKGHLAVSAFANTGTDEVVSLFQDTDAGVEFDYHGKHFNITVQKGQITLIALAGAEVKAEVRAKKPGDKATKSEIIAYLTSLEIEHDPKSTVAVLRELIPA